MPELPSGTVTFLFTDIEGSTRLLDELGDAYADTLAEHRRVLREAFQRYGGIEVDTQGDALFYAFPRATDAIAAAGAARQDLSGGPVRVRMGLHTGEPVVTDEGYVGIDVHRAARIMAAGHGGQVVVSQTTHELLDSSFELRDLGEHRLKDLSASQRLYQLGDANFPPLRSLYQTNLPIPATPFLGRKRELGAVVELLLRDEVRVLTLTGPGGTGKTRLALQAAAEATDRYKDGLFWVPLAPLRDPALALQTVAKVLDVTEDSGRPLAETLASALSGKQMLVVLDNFEHLLPEAARHISLLGSTPGLVLLVTSRERLQLQTEQVYPVPTLEESDAVELFLARARALDPSFTANSVVDELCARLDNLPLALELAAARTVIFSPEQLLERLGQRLDLLKAGPEADPRQRTLRATIEWSYDLLDSGEQRLFRGISVFAGGCTYEAAEEVCGADPDGLQSLLDKSLLRRRETDLGPRYWMLETIQQFAAEQLDESGKAAEVGRRHGHWFLAVARAAAPNLSGPEQVRWRDRLEEDYPNLRAALERSRAAAPEILTELPGLLWRFWYERGYLREGQAWVEEALVRQGREPTREREQLLAGAARFAAERGDTVAAREHVEERLAVARQLGDMLALARSLSLLSELVNEAGDVDQAVALGKEAVAICRNHTEASGYLCTMIHNLGYIWERAGEGRRAREAFEEALDLARAADNPEWIAAEQMSLGQIALLEGRHDEARSLLLAGVRLAVEGRVAQPFLSTALVGVAAIDASEGRWPRAARLLASVEHAGEQTGQVLPSHHQRTFDDLSATLHAQLDKEEFDSLWTEGRTMSIDEAAAAYALGSLD